MTLSEYVIDQATRWHECGRPVVIATIMKIHGSSSQPLASRMAITDRGEFAGFVSGGCVETDVNEQAQPVLADGSARRLQYGQTEDPLFEIGLNCEGQIEVVLERLNESVLADLRAAAPAVRVTAYRSVKDDEPRSVADDLGNGRVEMLHLIIGETMTKSDTIFDSPKVMSAVDTSRESGISGSITDDAGWSYLIEPVNRTWTLLIVSASSVAYPLCALGRALGYRVIVSDPRADYLLPDRFPGADRLLPVWPRDLPAHLDFGSDCVVVSLNHEPRFEDDLFRVLASQPPVAYIGAIGKRERHLERVGRQIAAGYNLAQLPTIHTPVGLDLGGKAPEEIAIAILAEIQAVRHGRSGAMLISRVDSTGGT